MTILIRQWQQQLHQRVGTNRKDDGSDIVVVRGGGQLQSLEPSTAPATAGWGGTMTGATSPPLTTIAVQLFCANPTSVFFLAAHSKSLLTMLTFAGDMHLLPGDSTSIASCKAREGGVADNERGASRGGKEQWLPCIVDGSGQTSTHHHCIVTLLSSHPPQLPVVVVDNGGSVFLVFFHT
jgi:hypothetical protein